MDWQTCRICGEMEQGLFRYGVRHYCHAQCGLTKWGSEFLRKIPAYQIGMLPYRIFDGNPELRNLAMQLNPSIKL